MDCNTPKDNLKVIPCLACLSESELKKLMIVIMTDTWGRYELPGDTAALLSDSACYTCLSKKQMLQLMVTTWAQIAYGQWNEQTDEWEGFDTTVDEIRAKIKCLLCASPSQTDGILSHLFCDLFNWN